MTTKSTPEETPKEQPAMKRRDLLEVSALVRRQKLDPADPVVMSLGVSYLTEHRAGETELSFKEWLDEDIPDESDDEPDEDPTGS